LVFARGEEHRTETLKKVFGLRSETIHFASYERVVIYAKVHEAEHFDAEQIDDLPFRPGSTFLKLFKDVPKHDLESLFPNIEVRMRPIDHFTIGVPAFVGGLVILFTKLLTSLGLVLLFLAGWIGLRSDEPEIDQAAPSAWVCRRSGASSGARSRSSRTARSSS
jgi:hypothetical protein